MGRMIRLTEPIPCPSCNRLVVPGEERWYDLLDDYTAGPVHVCHPELIDGQVAPTAPHTSAGAEE